jgi:molybdopterin converting factor small subunit
MSGREIAGASRFWAVRGLSSEGEAMKVTVEFLSLPIVVKSVGSKTVALDFSGTTVEDVVQEVAHKYGPDVRRFLLDDSGRLDMTFRVSLNGREWILREEMHRPLHDGDRVTIMMLVGGG